MKFKYKVNHKVLSEQTGEVIANVNQFMQRKAEKNKLLKDFTKLQERRALETEMYLMKCFLLNKCIYRW